MDVSAIAVQQAMAQGKMAMSIIKQNAQSEQALVNMIQQAAQSSDPSRGQNLDISV